ncbi:sulfite exporter TauE/SafE family protein [Thermoproteota archaeon]
MHSESLILITTALSIGFFHTLFGPDHYLPFIAMSKAREWSMRKTALITFLCGLGHVLSSVVLGFVGIILGVAVFKLEAFEGFRGEVAGWFLLIFGFTYFIWGLSKAVKGQTHSHEHAHESDMHGHVHSHAVEHVHVHDQVESKKNITPWILFTIFIFGPCEPLIPILMYPAAKGSMLLVVLVTLTFSIATIGTMMGIVIFFSLGLNKIPLFKLERYSHALAGLIILLCGGAMTFLGL